MVPIARRRRRARWARRCDAVDREVLPPIGGLKRTTGRTNVKPQTFKTAANAALQLGVHQLGALVMPSPQASIAYMRRAHVGIWSESSLYQGASHTQSFADFTLK